MSEPVDVRARSTQAAERNGGTGRLEDLERGMAIAKGLVITPTIGLTIGLAIIVIVGGMYYRTSDAIQTQGAASAKESRELRDMMIRMDQRLIDKDVHDGIQRKEIKEQQELHALQIQDLKVKLLASNTTRR